MFRRFMAILNRRDWIWLGACAASLAVGLKWGMTTKTPAGGLESGSSIHENAKLPGFCKRTGGAAGTASATPLAAGTSGAVSGAWLDSYQTFSTCRDPLKRQQMLAEALAGIDESNWESAWDPMWKSRKDGRISEEEWKLFMQKFGSVGHERMAEKGRPDDMANGWEVRHGIVGWATQDVAGSWDWI